VKATCYTDHMFLHINGRDPSYPSYQWKRLFIACGEDEGSVGTHRYAVPTGKWEHRTIFSGVLKIFPNPSELLSKSGPLSEAGCTLQFFLPLNHSMSYLFW